MSDELAKVQAEDRLDEFVPTRIAKEILGAAHMVMQRGGIALIHGGSGLGKTTALARLGREVQRCNFITIATAKVRMKALLLDICRSIGRPNWGRSTADAFDLTVRELKNYCSLLVVDEIHKACMRDELFHVLRDIYDQTRVPQIWSGTTNLISYFDRRMSQGHEPLAQIRRRIMVARDLNHLDGDAPCFTPAEIRRLLAPARHKLDAGAVRYMTQLANLENEGGLGLVKNLYWMAATLIQGEASATITSDLLHTAHGYLAARSTVEMVENKLASEAPEAEEATGNEQRRITA